MPVYSVLVLALVQTSTVERPEMTHEEAVSLAIETLRDAEGLRAEVIEVRRADAVEWPDASLGCKSPGETYAQVSTPGYRLLLSAKGAIYRVHVGGRTAVVCGGGLKAADARPVPSQEAEQAEPEPPIAHPEDPALSRLVTASKADLVKRLDIDPDDIELLEARSLVWPDASLGCPQPGLAYPQVLRDGALVRLRVGKRIYAYHGGGGREPFLCERPPKTYPQ